VTRSSAHDGGFGVIEVLVALAIASIATIALGAMSYLAIRVADAVSTSRNVQIALQDLQGVQQLLSERVASNVRQSTGSSFVLTSRVSLDGVAEVTLTGEVEQAALVLDGPLMSARADLAAFDEVGFEYLERADPSEARWVATSQRPDAVLGVRMRLQLGGRVWRPLIWIAPP
jgi:prepilin-type N-terminal cleavage/methylation domain-containing protein